MGLWRRELLPKEALSAHTNCERRLSRESFRPLCLWETLVTQSFLASAGEGNHSVTMTSPTFQEPLSQLRPQAGLTSSMQKARGGGAGAGLWACSHHPLPDPNPVWASFRPTAHRHSSVGLSVFILTRARILGRGRNPLPPCEQGAVSKEDRL